jgi:hypothetical protein
MKERQTRSSGPTVEPDGLRLELGDALLCMKAAVRPEVHVKRQAVSTHRPFRPENTSAPTAATESGEWPAFP